MRWIRFRSLVVVLMMVGCTTVTVMMHLDPMLAENAQVYEVSSPGKFFDARLNVSFGEYQVAEADTQSTVTRDPSEPDSFWIRMIFGILNVNTFSKKEFEVTTSHTYQFKIGDEMTWDAKCHSLVVEGEVKEVNDALITNQPAVKVRVKTLSSHYKCRYTALDHESWVLTIEQRRSKSEPAITMTNSDQHFEATATAGEYVAADGRNIWGSPGHTGYTWTRDNDSIGAVSVKGKPPRVWLHKDNSKTTNDVLSMGSAGLFIYHKEIVPTLKKG